MVTIQSNIGIIILMHCLDDGLLLDKVENFPQIFFGVTSHRVVCHRITRTLVFPAVSQTDVSEEQNN